MTTPTRTQADALPSKIDKIVDPINQLTIKKQFDNWVIIVESVLEQNDLDSLIDKDLPHPDEVCYMEESFQASKDLAFKPPQK